jgi:hypothetical protein
MTFRFCGPKIVWFCGDFSAIQSLQATTFHFCHSEIFCSTPPSLPSNPYKQWHYKWQPDSILDQSPPIKRALTAPT